jgi:hypothetical protein
MIGLDSSHEHEPLELRNLFLDGHLDSELQRQLCAGTADALAGQADVGVIVDDIDQLDVAAITLNVGTNPFEDALNVSPRLHLRPIKQVVFLHPC